MSVGPRTGILKWSLVATLAIAGGIVGVDRWAVRWDVALVLVAAIVGWLPGAVVLAATAIPHSLIHQDGVHSLNEFLVLAGVSLAAAAVLRRPVGTDVMPRRAALRFVLLATIALGGAAWALAISGTGWTRGNLGDEFLHIAIGLVLGAFVVWLPWPGWRFASVLWGPALALTVGFGVLLGTVGFWEQGDEELLQLTADSTASGFLNTLTDELNVLTAKAATSTTVDFTATTFSDLLQTIVFGDDLITSATLLQFDRPAGSVATVPLSDLGPDFEQSAVEWVRSKNVDELASTALLDQNVFLGLVWLPLPSGNQQPHLMYLSPLRTDGEISTDRPQAMVTSISIPSLMAKALAPALGSLNDVLVTVFEVGLGTFTPIWTSSSDSTAQGDSTALPAVDPVVQTGRSAASESSVDLTVLRFVAQRGENFGTPLTTRRLTLGLESLVTLVLFGTLLQTSHDRVRRENERRRREILLTTALEGAPGWTAIIDEDDCVLVGNADPGGVGVAARIHDAPIWQNDTLGTQRVVEAVQRARSGTDETLTLSPKHDHDPDHPIRIFEILARRIDSMGRDTLVFLQCVDVTERRELAMRTAQSERMESLGVLAGSLAHDFNNLLFITQGYLQMMERQPVVANDPQLLRFITKATDAVHRGATIAKSLLAVARSQPMSSVPLSMEQFLIDLDPLLTQALSGTPDIVLLKEVVGDDLDVVVDPGRLSSAVLNLVFNARDAMEAAGSITIRIERTMATNPAGDVREVIAVQVRDTGKGMSPEVAARAYEPFFTTGKVGKGTGLGLAAVYSFAQQSGGWTTIDSREGAGTTVSIFLQPAIAGHSTAVPLEHTDDQRLRALVVDDEESLAELVAGWLGELGLETRVATDSAMAVSLAREFEPHLLLSDSNLGEETDGAALAQKLTESLPTLVTVFMTGFSDRLRALETVGVMTLAKPFSRDDLQMALVKVLGPRFATSTEPTGTQS